MGELQEFGEGLFPGDELVLALGEEILDIGTEGDGAIDGRVGAALVGTDVDEIFVIAVDGHGGAEFSSGLSVEVIDEEALESAKAGEDIDRGVATTGGDGA